MLGRSSPLHVPPIGPPDSCRKMSVSGCVWAIDAPSYIHAKDEKWQRNKSWYARGMHHRVHGQHERQPNASSTRGGKYDSQAHPPRLCTMAKSPSIRLRVPFVGHSSRPSSCLLYTSDAAIFCALCVWRSACSHTRKAAISRKMVIRFFVSAQMLGVVHETFSSSRCLCDLVVTRTSGICEPCNAEGRMHNRPHARCGPPTRRSQVTSSVHEQSP